MNSNNVIRWLGIILMAVGVLGFVPALTPDDLLLGIFHVNALHNLIHIVTGGALWYAAGATEPGASGLLKTLAVVYGLVAILGFMVGEGEILGLVANNGADNLLHLVLTALFAYWGFGPKRDTAAA